MQAGILSMWDEYANAPPYHTWQTTADGGKDATRLVTSGSPPLPPRTSDIASVMKPSDRHGVTPTPERLRQRMLLRSLTTGARTPRPWVVCKMGQVLYFIYYFMCVCDINNLLRYLEEMIFFCCKARAK